MKGSDCHIQIQLASDGSLSDAADAMNDVTQSHAFEDKFS